MLLRHCGLVDATREAEEIQVMVGEYPRGPATAAKDHPIPDYSKRLDPAFGSRRLARAASRGPCHWWPFDLLRPARRRKGRMSRQICQCSAQFPKLRGLIQHAIHIGWNVALGHQPLAPTSQ